MHDAFGRKIDYLRLSVTDRCDLRCTYCMPERMRFGPRHELLTIDELDRLAAIFIRKGVRKLRITGGEPLVRKGVLDLFDRLRRHLDSSDLEELTLTTNGTLLEHAAERLAAAGVRRVNVSMDHFNPADYSRITRGGDVSRVAAGIVAAQAAGLAVKINIVVLREDNLADLPEIIAWVHARGCAATLIEVMPMGDVGADRIDQHVPMTEVRALLEQHFTLHALTLRTGGPARYFEAQGSGRIGFITPLTDNFCATCNRVRVGADGQLHACLGRSVATDLRSMLRGSDNDLPLDAAIETLLDRKPERHDFSIRRGGVPAVDRVMSVTGG